MALVSKGVNLDIVGSDEIDSPELHTTPNLRFLNFRGSQRSNANFAEKLSKLLVYYAKLIRYAARSKPKILHILWNNKFEFFDRTILMLYYKAAGKKNCPHRAQCESSKARRERLAGSIASRSKFSTGFVTTFSSTRKR